MHKVKEYFLIFLLAVCTISCAPQQKCNFRSADISTISGEHCVLAGFAARNGLSTDIHIPLRTSALAITDGKKTILLISNDMMEISPESSLMIRREISQKTGLPVDNIIMHCIHTHSAPRVGGVSTLEGGTNYTYKERTFKTIIDNAVTSVLDEKSYRPFKIKIAKGTAPINRNRCEKAGPVDPTLYAAKLEDASGKPICAFYNIACHPVCMGPSSYMVSSDYSGVARNIISKKWGCEVFQFTGAAGNMDPNTGPKSVEEAEDVGTQLASVLDTLRFESVKVENILRIYNSVARLPFRIEKVSVESIVAHADSIVHAYKTNFPRFSDDVRSWEKEIINRFKKGAVPDKLDFYLSAVNLNGVIFFFTQGEPFCEYQIEAREKFKDNVVFFTGYTNGQNSYLPSEHAYEVHKGYEYEIDQMHIYIKSPYPLSSSMPKIYKSSIFDAIENVLYDKIKFKEPVYNIIPAPRNISSIDAWYSFTGEPDVKYVKNLRIPQEGYILDITEKGIKIEFGDVAGKFYAFETLKQMLDASVYRTGFRNRDWSVPCCRIEDAPEYSYRGLLLDCGRHFFSKEEVMKFIDLMAMHKMNMLHWHLTEDQGWRIEIKKYPRLTEVGAWRKETKGYRKIGDGIPHGGFYSQDDIREIVAYASERNVNIIPEIEIPGHSSAAIAAYPYLSCTPEEPKEVSTEWGIKEDVYCPSPSTFKFLEDVLMELIELFPSKYYHIGGDECPRTAWRNSEYCHNIVDSLGLSCVDDIQYHFVKHFDKFLREHGKIVIGWDEILYGNVVDSTVVMSYRGHAPAEKAMEKGMKTILSPNRWCYYDYKQEEIDDLPSNKHLFITLRKAYNYDYRNIMDSISVARSKDALLGFQACLWTESISTPESLEYQAFPRVAAISETCWTPSYKHNWIDFCKRIPKEFERLDAKGVNYCKAYYDVIVNMDLESHYPRKVELELDYPYAKIHFTTDGTKPTLLSPEYIDEITVARGDRIRACGFDFEGKMIGEPIDRIF